jgi:hypothetical protein
MNETDLSSNQIDKDIIIMGEINNILIETFGNHPWEFKNAIHPSPFRGLALKYNVSLRHIYQLRKIVVRAACAVVDL